ncbi:MAG: protein-glutamate O-methyltransferase CheR [Verrucomicrobia bacterium]|nr:protein-glutamate O-methyltransferase CheR [Verrucomicrobiota bacterium]MCA0186691.1 protein-glutamate O-methyltransferase CheR [Pseudomonadota bacterium]
MDAFFAANLSQGAYRLLVDLVYQHSRIRVGSDKQPMLANRLRRRLRELHLTSFDEYCARLQSADGAEEIEHLVDLISTNHTRFFREPEHFTALSERILPEWTSRLLADRSPLRIWSAAASSGEEPYTLALTVADFARAFPTLDWQIEATDISQRVLQRARAGIYPLEAVESMPPEQLKRHFQRGVGTREGTVRVKAELRDRVRFQRVNLFQPEYPVPPEQHVIFCRNVMIYFDLPSRATVVHKLSRHLAPGGYLVIGHSENLLGIPHRLEPLRHGIYRVS